MFSSAGRRSIGSSLTDLVQKLAQSASASAESSAASVLLASAAAFSSGLRSLAAVRFDGNAEVRTAVMAEIV